jgi:RND family efflux transporter MFP subunit
MTRSLRIVLPVLVLAFGFVAALFIVRSRPEVDRREPEPAAPLVRAVVAEPQTVRLDVAAQGTVAPATRSVLVAQVAGRIERTTSRFETGALFRRGDLLVAIDASDFHLAVAQAEAGVAAAQVRLARELAEAEIARREWEEIGEGDPSPLTLREPQLAEARAALQGAEATLERARLELSRTSIRAPFDGRVESTSVDAGQFVTPGTALGSLYATDVAEVALPVAPRDLVFLDIGLAENPGNSGPTAEIDARLAGATHRWKGRVVRTSGQFDERTRMLTVFVEILDPLGLASDNPPLMMGAFVDATIAGRSVGGVVVLPRSALRSDNRVLIIDEEDRLQFRNIEILRIQEDQVVVAGGLRTGERVCVSPLETALEGMKVRIASEADPTVEPQEESWS